MSVRKLILNCNKKLTIKTKNNYPGEPAWLREAKFGIRVHVGPQSASESGGWHARRLYSQRTVANQNHLKKYDHLSDLGYKEVLHDLYPTKFDPALKKTRGTIFKKIGEKT
jgi:hypothetical protein